MASRLRCANCHNHPLDQWTQDDYHGLAAILATIRVSESVVDQLSPKSLIPKLDAMHCRSYRLELVIARSGCRPKLGHGICGLAGCEREPLFAKAIVNRLWKVMMGRGLVDPVDDFRQTNPATHPELLDELSSSLLNRVMT